MEEGNGKIALHGQESGHDGCPILLGRVGRELLVCGGIADKKVHLPVVFYLVPYDSCPSFVWGMDRDGIVVLKLFDCLPFLTRDVRLRGLGMG